MKVIRMPPINNLGGVEFHVALTAAERTELRASEASFKEVCLRIHVELVQQLATAAAEK
jgi:hypothetical protein